ncbi:MAG: TonB family protein [Planctomycetaceae bacterium]
MFFPSFRLPRHPGMTLLISLKSSVLLHVLGLGAFLFASEYLILNNDASAELAGRSGVIVIQLTSSPSAPSPPPAVEVEQLPPEEPTPSPTSEAPPLAAETSPAQESTDAPIAQTTPDKQATADEVIVEELIAVTNEPLPAQQVAATPSRQVAATSAPASPPPSPMAVASATPSRAPAAPPSVASPAIPPLALGIEKVERPVFANNAPPEYPALAQANGWHGTVLLRLTIDETGLVREVKIESSSGFAILDQAAQKAVATWKAQPAKKNGRTVQTVELLPVIFKPRI